MSEKESVNLKPSEETAAAPVGATDEPVEEPRKKKRKKNSRWLRDAAKIERRLSKTALRMSSAVTEGVETYCRERDRSAERKRDGALLDIPLNAAEGLAATLEKSSRIPVDVARAFDTRSTRWAVRLGARILLWPLRR